MVRLLIDCHALAYRAFYSTGSLSHEDRATGIPYGFFITLKDLSKRFRSNQFVFLWDGAGSKRRGIYPDYKSSRWEKKTPEELEKRKEIHAQIDALREDILPACGFKNSFIQAGYEADDLMAAMVEAQESRVHKAQMIGVSGDHDLFQLLRFRWFSLYTPSTSKLWDASAFSLEFGIPAREWISVKSIAGCSTDGVPGVPGVGEKTAIQYLCDELKAGSAKEKAIRAAGELIKRNLKLVRLPFPGVAPMEVKEDQFEGKNLLAVFEDLGFESFLKKEARAEWELFALKNKKMEELF